MSNYPDFEDLNTGSSDCEDHFYIVAQRLLDAIRANHMAIDHCQVDVTDHVLEVRSDIKYLREDIIQRIKTIEAKLDAMEHRLLPPGCLYIPKPEITPAGQTANVCISDPFHVAETHLEGKP